jgi:hypothetical protein
MDKAPSTSPLYYRQLAIADAIMHCFMLPGMNAEASSPAAARKKPKQPVALSLQCSG